MKNDEMKKASFRELMDEFDATCAQFDTDQVDVEQAIKLHGKATQLLSELERRLQRAEVTIKKTKS